MEGKGRSKAPPRDASISLHIYFSPVHSFIPMESTLRVSISLHAAHFEVGQKGVPSRGRRMAGISGESPDGETVALAQLKSIAEEGKTRGRVCGKTARTQFGDVQYIFALLYHPLGLDIFSRDGGTNNFHFNLPFFGGCQTQHEQMTSCWADFSKGFPSSRRQKNRLSGKLH